MKPKLLLGLSAQFVSQRRKVDRHPRFGNEGLFRSRPTQSELPPSYTNVPPVGPLRSTGITPLLRYYEPLRRLHGPTNGYVFPSAVDGDPSPIQASQAPRLIFPYVLSPLTPREARGLDARFFVLGGRLHTRLAGWPLSRCIDHEAEPGSLSLRPIRLLHGASAAFPGRCPLRYLLNEQFTGQTPLSLLDQPGLSWRFQSSILNPSIFNRSSRLSHLAS